ncbi:MAG TPA: DUF1697 domain-containing protein [Bryobacteraceae bacterium]|nr:DUF1697 domain-containing protein [Bryobacteraceae bacterium]
MPVLISLLRGINVGGSHMIKMDALRKAYEDAGLRNATTLLQTGNVVFRAVEPDRAKLAARIETAIESSAGFRPAVILRTAAEVAQTVSSNPFPEHARTAPSKLLVTFFASDPGPNVREAINATQTGPEQLSMIGSDLYIFFPNGMGRSKLSFASLERSAKIATTSRNWNTVTKLLNMARSLEESR